MTRCNYCGGSVYRERRDRQPYDNSVEYRFECQSCGEVVDLLRMDGVGWEPSEMVDVGGEGE